MRQSHVVNKIVMQYKTSLMSGLQDVTFLTLLNKCFRATVLRLLSRTCHIKSNAVKFNQVTEFLIL